jgi:hypothetical protein
VLFSSLGISFIFGALNGMKKVGLNRLFGWENAFLALFLGFGTSQFSLTLRPLVNFTSQVLATTFLSLSLYFIFSGSARSVKLYALFSGIALGLAVLSRPNVVFAWIVVASILVYRQQMNNEIAVKKIITPLIISLIPIGIVILILFWYNTIRFGSPFDFGYGYMLVADTLKQDLIVYGQFHPQFIFRNIFDNFLRLPYWSNSCQMITPQPEGTSILLASPVIVYLVCSFRKKLYTIGAWISIILLTLLHLLYYNSGAVQFGYRFSMDFMPIVVSLLAFGFNEKLSKGAIILILFSIAANFIGTLWIVHRWCINY